MARAKVVDPGKAGEILGLHDAGVSVKEIATQTGISERTIRRILNGLDDWDNIKLTDDTLREIRRETRTRLLAGTAKVAVQALRRVEEMLPSASAKDAVIVLGTLIDKNRLLAGEATEYVGHLHVHEMKALDRLADKLVAERARRGLAKEIDITPEPATAPM